MAWTIEFDPFAAKQLARLGKADALRIRNFLRDRLAPLDDPRSLGTSLQGSRFSGVWRYRVGDYRVSCEIKDDRVVVLVVAIAHRREVYR